MGHAGGGPSGATEPLDNAGHDADGTFETTGTHEYVCIPHETLGMIGTITVE
ncbi:MAG: plastocyanin/azurin family copper-binding protein [Halococcoides sp.]